MSDPMKLFDPARLPARDEYGNTFHPDLPEWDEGTDGVALLGQMGFDVAFTMMDGDAPDELVERHFEDGDPKACAEWTPTPRPGWLLAGIWDTEDGPVALFVRRQLTFAAVTAANLDRCNRWHPGGIADWSPERWDTAMNGELGELAEAFILLKVVVGAGEVANTLKKLFRVEDAIANISEPGREILDRATAIKKVGGELADTFLYLNLLACRLDIKLEDEIVAKFNSVSEKYGFPERL